MTTLPVDIDGLNLILGGGVPLIKRDEDLDESATILIRGTPGSGKTIFGTQLAGSIARSLKCDVAYGCVELLPTELAAQHAGLDRDVPERVVVLRPQSGGTSYDLLLDTDDQGDEPKGQSPSDPEECRIFAGLLDIGEAGQEQERLEPAVLGLLAAVEEAGGRPRVLVIDSLSDGYRLGSSAPRELADALCKLAVQRGMVLILLEEIVESRPSAWSFATDVVMELGIGESPRGLGPFESLHRRLILAKNRFSPSEPGPHRFTVQSEHGVRVYPILSTYLRPWAMGILLQQWKPTPHTWQWGAIENQQKLGTADVAPLLPDFAQCTTLVYGRYFHMVASAAYMVGIADSSPRQFTDILLNFSKESTSPKQAIKAVTSSVMLVRVGGPIIDSDQFLVDSFSALSRISAEDHRLGRLLIGDLHDLEQHWQREEILRALEVLLVSAKSARIPTILFESHQDKSESAYRRLADVAIRVIAYTPGDKDNPPLVSVGRNREMRVSRGFQPDPSKATELLKYF